MEEVFMQTQRIREASGSSLKDMCAPPMSLVADLGRAFERAVADVQGDHLQAPGPSATSEYDSLELLRRRAEEEVQSLRREGAGAGSAQSLSKLQEELLEQGAALEHVRALERARSEEEAKYATRKRAAETAEAEYRKYGKLSVAKQLKLDTPQKETERKGGEGRGRDTDLLRQRLTEPLFFILCELETWKDGNEGIAPFTVEVTAAPGERPRSQGSNKTEGNRSGDEGDNKNEDSASNGIAAVHPWRVVARFAKVNVGFTHLVNLGVVSVKAWSAGDGREKGEDDGRNREDEEGCQVPLERVFPEGGDGRTLPTLESVYYVYKALGGRGHHCEEIEREWYPEEALGKPYAWAQMLAGIQVSNIREAKYISVLEFLEGINKLN